jgi:hypothetical protein
VTTDLHGAELSGAVLAYLVRFTNGGVISHWLFSPAVTKSKLPLQVYGGFPAQSVQLLRPLLSSRTHSYNAPPRTLTELVGFPRSLSRLQTTQNLAHQTRLSFNI